ncbi:hypothetical protein AVEN_18867-1 [Araneus ventricosus]|uniref:Uncharacterized protein n=1 Tax=Araneus ventricosus TaxID=182803 RepID=A0A4Y2CBW0_ARAVE|nr:hypothetical protein AVEN_18867-1 [Araneus ventricosus]
MKVIFHCAAIYIRKGELLSAFRTIIWSLSVILPVSKVKLYFIVLPSTSRKGELLSAPLSAISGFCGLIFYCAAIYIRKGDCNFPGFKVEAIFHCAAIYIRKG